MAAGLFASLFAASSSSSSTAAADAGPSAQQNGSHQSASDSDAQSDETEQQHSPLTPDHDVDMPDAPPSKSPSSTIAAATTHNLKEAQDVADVDMQLSSPPSSPPPSVPHTPHHASSSSLSHAHVRSTKTELTSSGSGKPATSSNSPSSTPAPERASMPATGRAGSNSAPTVQRASRRRTMPARLSQVSSLLAGSMLEEELMLLEAPSSPSGSSFQHNKSEGASTSAIVGQQGADASSHLRPEAANFFSASSIVVLTSDARLLARAVYPNAPSIEAKIKSERQDDDLSSTAPVSTPSRSADSVGFLRPPLASSSSSSSLVSTLAIKRQQLIETPDFKQRDDTLYMPKTRGLRSEAAEDTSDAAYERRHRKPETAEKRQRKAEVDRLSRDRHKLLSRIEQLKTVEARMLQPIVVARDQVRAEASAKSQDASPPASAPMSERIEDLRKELLDDAYETLKRYDLLLSISADTKLASPGPSTLASKSEAAAAAVEDDGARSQSPRLKIRIKAGRATWETADSASPTTKQSSSAHSDKDTVSRRVSARQPKHRVESLPTPLTAAAIEAVEDSRRKRRRRSASQLEEESPARRKAGAAHHEETPTISRKTNESESPERRTRRRGSPEVGGTYKGKSTAKEGEGPASSARTTGRPQRAAAAAAAVASARQRKYAERSFSDFDYDDEDEEVESALEDVQVSGSGTLGRRTSHSIRRSPVKPRDQRSPSASSVTSSVSSLASSLGYMYPTVVDTGSSKVSQSLAEIQASDPEAMSSSPILAACDASPKKRLKLVLSRSPSAAAGLGEVKKVLTEISDEDIEEPSNGKGRALTESEAESILAAFLGTTPIGKSVRTQEPAAVAVAASTSATTVKEKTSTSTPSKRRSTRRETTQSFGEKLPDLLTKHAQFDFSVMEYLRSIDKPKRSGGSG